MTIITARGVAKTYKSGQTALHPIDLAIERREIFALLGPNGAGKTTLISIICSTVTASAGEVSIDGTTSGAIIARRARWSGWCRRRSRSISS